MFLPTIGIVVHFLSTASHPRAEAMSPQGGLALFHVHSPHSATQNPSFPSTCTTQGMGSPFSATQSLEPSHFPPRLQCTWLARKTHNNLLKALEQFSSIGNTLQAHNPIYRTQFTGTTHIFNINLPFHGCSHTQQSWCSFPSTQLSLTVQKSAL
jgi:hypothetical protein